MNIDDMLSKLINPSLISIDSPIKLSLDSRSTHDRRLTTNSYQFSLLGRNWKRTRNRKFTIDVTVTITITKCDMISIRKDGNFRGEH